jgi:hypothetical protein
MTNLIVVLLCLVMLSLSLWMLTSCQNRRKKQSHYLDLRKDSLLAQEHSLRRLREQKK